MRYIPFNLWVLLILPAVSSAITKNIGSSLRKLKSDEVNFFGSTQDTDDLEESIPENAVPLTELPTSPPTAYDDDEEFPATAEEPTQETDPTEYVPESIEFPTSPPTAYDDDEEFPATSEEPTQETDPTEYVPELTEFSTSPPTADDEEFPATSEEPTQETDPTEYASELTEFPTASPTAYDDDEEFPATSEEPTKETDPTEYASELTESPTASPTAYDDDEDPFDYTQATITQSLTPSPTVADGTLKPTTLHHKNKHSTPPSPTAADGTSKPTSLHHKNKYSTPPSPTAADGTSRPTTVEFSATLAPTAADGTPVPTTVEFSATLAPTAADGTSKPTSLHHKNKHSTPPSPTEADSTSKPTTLHHKIKHSKSSAPTFLEIDDQKTWANMTKEQDDDPYELNYDDEIQIGDYDEKWSLDDVVAEKILPTIVDDYFNTTDDLDDYFVDANDIAEKEDHTFLGDDEDDDKYSPPTDDPVQVTPEEQDYVTQLESRIKELDQQLVQEAKDHLKYVYLGGMITLVLLIITAHQMKVNPQGLWAGLCRLLVMCAALLFRIICTPCRMICCRGEKANLRKTSGRVPLGDDRHFHSDLDLELT